MSSFNFTIVSDIDGVIVMGKDVIPKSDRAMRVI